ncbi:MAG: hypothetical protein JW958_14555 [Candidatus Eisenbacteria bacterium]|nr:hypothetical protein [Candidatus Eisenbacteria bacterium]
MRRFYLSAIFLFLPLLLSACGGGKDEGGGRRAADKPAPKLTLERYDGGFFSIERPAGWEVLTAGECGTFAFLVRDPAEPLNRVFYFGQVGPVYLSAQQKQIDIQYMNMGGFPVAWHEMPVVEPFTPGVFLAAFHQIARTGVARGFMPACPRLDGVHIIASSPQPCPLPGGSTALIRALFSEEGRVGEGLFHLTTAPFMPFTGGPGGGNGYGTLFTGVTASKEAFPGMVESLVRCASSFTIDPSYVNNCMQMQQRAWAGVMKAGRTLSDASDIIMEGWESRNRSDDILAEKRSDAILGTERLYDPNTGDVYSFKNGFFDDYDIRREQYEMSDLQPLPESDHDLWTRAPLDGPQNIR